MTTFQRPTPQAMYALQRMLHEAFIEPVGGGAVEWSAVIDGQHLSVTIGPDGDWRSTASWADDDLNYKEPPRPEPSRPFKKV